MQSIPKKINFSKLVKERVEKVYWESWWNELRLSHRQIDIQYKSTLCRDQNAKGKEMRSCYIKLHSKRYQMAVFKRVSGNLGVLSEYIGDIPDYAKLCPFCRDNSVEDTVHFISNCKLYADNRITRIPNIGNEVRSIAK